MRAHGSAVGAVEDNIRVGLASVDLGKGAEDNTAVGRVSDCHDHCNEAVSPKSKIRRV